MKFNDYEDEIQLLIDKVEGANDKSWIELISDLSLDIHPDSLRKSFSGGRYGGYNIAKYFQKRLSEEYMSDEEIEKLDNKKDEVYKEICKLSDANREKRKYLREEARFEKLLSTLKESMEFLPEIKINVCEKKINNGLEASLLLSDIHAGLVVDNVINYYDNEVVIERLSELCSKTIKYCKLHNVNKLNIELLGDFVSGIINISSRCDQEEDVISQTVTVSEIISQFINNLKKEIPIVTIFGIVGNHARIDSNKKSNLPRENFERLVYKFISMRLNQTVIQNGFEDFLSYFIGNREIVLTHGDKDSIITAKKHFNDLLHKSVQEIHMGHWHEFNIKDDSGTEIVVNGSVISTDDYTISIRKDTKASQVLRIYDDDVATYKIELN